MPVLQEMYEKYSGQVEFVSITKQDDHHADGLEQSRQWVSENSPPWLFSEDQHVVQAYEFSTIPHTLLINEDGFVMYIWKGFAEPAAFEYQIRQVLGLPVEQPPAEVQDESAEAAADSA